MANAPTVSSGSKTTFDDTSNFKVDISDAIEALDPRDTPCLARFGKSSLRTPCIETTHYWLEDELIPTAAEVDAAYTSGTLNFNLRPVGAASGTDASTYFKVDDVLYITGQHYQVTSIASNLVYVRLLSSADAAKSVGDKVYNLGTAATEGSVARVVGEWTTLDKPYNYTQIFKDEVNVTGTQEAIAKYGYTSELDYQLSKRLQELAIKMERDFIYGIRNVATVNNQPMRMMGGLWYFIRNAAGGTANTDIIKTAASAALSQSLIDGVLENLWALGGAPDLIICGGYQKRVIDAWMTPYVQVGMNQSQLGTTISTYRSSYGDVSIMLNRYVHPTDLIIVSSKYIGLGPLTGRAFSTETLPKTGDYQGRMMLGEYTMEVRCVGRAHGWIHTLATS